MTSIVSNPTANIVECCDLTVVRDSKEILCEATCCVPRNSLTFLVGENGSGKTTLVKTILGLL
ncbi:MAG: ABC transporter ATP-binding protein, partial [Chloroflexi bacterium]|nr:ABC transporter ATP-binding protein [Chloroflexota bacterium]